MCLFVCFVCVFVWSCVCELGCLLVCLLVRMCVCLFAGLPTSLMVSMYVCFVWWVVCLFVCWFAIVPATLFAFFVTFVCLFGQCVLLCCPPGCVSVCLYVCP